ncbi:hypothetical protein HS088_TW16G00415 [Tripterygium wilfordii]|uniref:F-box domain-containing protein n=1 Tax=Tripterygium wilfordii TaxID=458696 RepID=A0A7J7CIW5_TRIWF|nr:F-box/FBD/LRR-repeat protein At1g13570-like [Tripterygium wilfordii]KAF5733974.1 hypothetical protein HS088_TW16G00415 [Tripterygium wilfordii]
MSSSGSSSSRTRSGSASVTISTRTSSLSPLDLITELPGNIVDNILRRLPLQDAVRTSILSKRWRYRWLTLSQLLFDYQPHQQLDSFAKTKLVIAVYQALLNHQGPLVKFSLSVPDLGNCPDINHWLQFLSNRDVQDFTLRIWTGEPYKLPDHFYSFAHLKHLNIHNCVFKPPSKLKGFDRLVSLEFRNVIFAAERFGIFVSNCPVLEILKLVDCPHFYCLRINAPCLKQLSFYGTFSTISLKNTPLLATVSIALNGMTEIAKYFKDGKSSNLIETVSGLHSIETLSAELDFVKFLAIGGINKRLPMTLDHLKILNLSNVHFDKFQEVSCTLCLISSSPNLQKLTIKASTGANPTVQTVAEYLKVQEFSDCSLDRLQVVKILEVSGVPAELELMKILLAASSSLEKLEILPREEKSIETEYKILRELIRFRRASPKAEIMFLDSESE